MSESDRVARGATVMQHGAGGHSGAAPEHGAQPILTRPRGLPISERPFGITEQALADNRERAPLVQIFERACLSWLQRSISSQSHGIGQNLRLDGGDQKPVAIAAECGCYQGFSLAACLEIAEQSNLPVQFLALDSFQGLPPLSQRDLELAPERAPYRNRKFFDATSVEKVQATVAPVLGKSRVDIVPGFFSETLPTLPEHRYFFVNIDCDLYEPHLECLDYFYPRMLSGGIIFFDDYHSIDFPMARQAIDAFLADKPELLWHVRLGDEGPNLTKAYFVKR